MELDSASLFSLEVNGFINSAGEEHGTRYVDGECDGHGAGKQVSDLCLSPAKIPGNVDIASTIGSEVVIARHLVDAITKEGATGLHVRQVRDPKGKINSDWLQLITDVPSVHVSPETQYGITPFDSDPNGEYRCERCHILGLNRLTEIKIVGPQPLEDWNTTFEFRGTRRGLIRPRREILVTQRIRRLLVESRARGFSIEIAHVEDRTISFAR